MGFIAHFRLLNYPFLYLRIHDPTSKAVTFPGKSVSLSHQWISRQYQRPKPSIFRPTSSSDRRSTSRYLSGRAFSSAKAIECRNPCHPRVEIAAAACKYRRRSRTRAIDNPVVRETKKGLIHFVGIGGCGLSVLAMLALKQGCEASGSDIAWSSFVDGLQEAGALSHTGHSVANIQGSGASRSPEAAFVCIVRRSSCVSTVESCPTKGFLRLGYFPYCQLVLWWNLNFIMVSEQVVP